jgi:hypothetical protein
MQVWSIKDMLFYINYDYILWYGKRRLNCFLRKLQEWNSKMKGYDSTLCVFCTKWDNNTKSRKVSEIRLKKNKHNILIF